MAEYQYEKADCKNKLNFFSPKSISAGTVALTGGETVLPGHATTE